VRSRLNSLRSTSRVTTQDDDVLAPEDVDSEGIGRRKKMSASALGMTLILAGVLGAIVTTRTMTRSVAVVASDRNLEVGHVVTPGDLRAIDVASSSAKFFIGRDDVSSLIGTVVVSPLDAGTPFTPQAVTKRPVLDPSTVLVSVAVEYGNYPPMLVAGDDVSVVVSPDVTLVDASPPRLVAERLRVWDVDQSDDGNQLTVVTLIGNAQIALDIAGAGAIHLGLVPASAGG
jgi:hypothetical protein